MYDESVKALPVGQMYVQHAYPTGSVMKTEGLGTLDFSDKSYGYSNKARHKDGHLEIKKDNLPEVLL